MSSAYLAGVHLHHSTQTFQVDGFGRYLLRRLLLHTLLRTGGWVLVLLVGVAFVVAVQFARRRR